MSSTPVTVTVWTSAQLVVVKSSVAGLTRAAVSSAEASATLTAAVGRLASATV